MADESQRLPFDHDHDGRRYITRWALDGRSIPRLVRCYECQQPDAVWIPELGVSVHIGSVWAEREDAISAASAELREQALDTLRRLIEVRKLATT